MIDVNHDEDEEGEHQDEDEDGEHEDDAKDDEEFEGSEVNIPQTSPERAHAFTKTMRQLKTFHEEISLISGKKPDNPINKFKLGLINEALENANFVLGEEFLPFPGFKKFDEANMPTASDVVLMLSHYIDGLEAFEDKYCMGTHWNVTGNKEFREVEDD